MPFVNMKVPDKEANDYLILHTESDEKEAKKIQKRLATLGLSGQISGDILPGACVLNEVARLVKEVTIIFTLVTINLDQNVAIIKDETILKNIHKPDKGTFSVSLFLEPVRKLKERIESNAEICPNAFAGLFSRSGLNVNSTLFDKQVDKLKKTIATNIESNPHLQKNGSCVNGRAIDVHDTPNSIAQGIAPENGSDVETSINQDAKPPADVPTGSFLSTPPPVDKKQPSRVSGPPQNWTTQNPQTGQKRALTDSGGPVNDDQNDFQSDLGFRSDNSGQTKIVHAIGKENCCKSSKQEISKECIDAIYLKLTVLGNDEKRRILSDFVDTREADVEKDDNGSNFFPHPEKRTNSIGNIMGVLIPANGA